MCLMLIGGPIGIQQDTGKRHLKSDIAEAKDGSEGHQRR